MLEVSVPAPIVAHLGSIPVSNAVIAAYVTTGFLVLFALYVRRRLSAVPGRAQAALELIFEYIDEQLTQAFGGKKEGRAFFPFVMTLLLFIALANQLSLFPILFQVLVEGKPLMRLATSDLSETLTLGLLVVLLSHVLALVVSPIRHIGGYLRFGALLRVRSLKDLGGALIEVFLGLMDIIGEFAKIVSISCRLFGNLFAGDVMVAVIISLSTFTQFLVPIPFIFLGLFSGIVQAFVFTLLTIQFLAGPVNSARAHREEREQAKREASSAESVGVAV